MLWHLDWIPDDSVSYLLPLFPPPQAYFRQGVALQYLGRHADALAAFASGLAQDPKSLQLLVGMVEAAMKSPLRGKKFSLCVSADGVLACLRVSLSVCVFVSARFVLQLLGGLSPR